MKKLFAIVCMMLMSTAMFAQSNMTSRAGIGMSSYAGDDTDGYKSAFSYKIGVDYDYAINDAFSIIPGLELVNKGFKADNLDGTVNMFFIQIPIFAAYKFDVAEGMKLAVKAGPYLSYGLFGSDIEWSYGNGTTKKVNIFDSDGDTERFQAGIIAGVALDLGQYVIGAEISRGFTKAYKEAKVYQMCYGVTFGYKF